MDEQKTDVRGCQPSDEPAGQATGSCPSGRGLRRALADVEAFGSAVLRMPLRPYQAEVARAVLASVAEGRGHSLTVLMPRQSGKNQLSGTCP